MRWLKKLPDRKSQQILCSVKIKHATDITRILAPGAAQGFRFRTVSVNFSHSRSRPRIAVSYRTTRCLQLQFYQLTLPEPAHLTLSPFYFRFVVLITSSVIWSSVMIFIHNQINQNHFHVLNYFSTSTVLELWLSFFFTLTD